MLGNSGTYTDTIYVRWREMLQLPCTMKAIIGKDRQGVVRVVTVG